MLKEVEFKSGKVSYNLRDEMLEKVTEATLHVLQATYYAGEEKTVMPIFEQFIATYRRFLPAGSEVWTWTDVTYVEIEGIGLIEIHIANARLRRFLVAAYSIVAEAYLHRAGIENVVNALDVIQMDANNVLFDESAKTDQPRNEAGERNPGLN